MKAFTHSPAEIFGNQIRYVVPLYQRPYVWTEEEQWQPLWDDVSALADQVLDAPTHYGAPPVPPHFLGAIVVDQLPGPVTHIGTRSVIDGQQRLTTLQLLLDAAQAVVAAHGRQIDATALRVIVTNEGQLAADPDHVFKVWPTDRDQEAFRASMRDDLQPHGGVEKSAIAKAHAFFTAAVLEWAKVDQAPTGTGERLAALTIALRDKLHLVVINLEPGDNAQVIFETLNHRGAPLLAADLIKNLLFQVAASHGLDVEVLYQKYWRTLDDDYWRALVTQGRRFRPRIDVFMHRWLVMNLLRDVPADRVFTEFRDSVVARPGVDVADLFAQLAADAAVHRAWELMPETNVPGRFHYRVLGALDTQVLAPVFLWLTRHGEESMPRSERDAALTVIESWVVRRALIRATTKDYNNAALDLLRALVRGGPASAGASARNFLAGQSAESRYWPNDSRVVSVLTTERIYKALTRPRLRMVLEALEDDARGPLGEGQAAPKGLTVEHVMPQAWREHWGADLAGDLAGAQRRDEIVQTLGNLTLVNGKLNPTLSNRPWTDAESASRGLGGQGKRDYLLQHSQLKLNASLVYAHPERWDEQRIVARTEMLITRVLALWPCDPGAIQPATPGVPVVETPTDSVTDSVAPTWSDGDSVAVAAQLWLRMSPTARLLMDILVKVAPAKVSAPDLAAHLDLETGPHGVAGLLSTPGEVAAALGRAHPVQWEQGESSSYWMDAATAGTFEAAMSLAASEDFIATLLADPGPTQRTGTRRRNGSVPDHVRDVFAGLPPYVELTLGEIKKRTSAGYAAGEISSGAVAAALDAGAVDGFEWAPGVSPRRVRRTRWGTSA